MKQQNGLRNNSDNAPEAPMNTPLSKSAVLCYALLAIAGTLWFLLWVAAPLIYTSPHLPIESKPDLKLLWHTKTLYFLANGAILGGWLYITRKEKIALKRYAYAVLAASFTSFGAALLACIIVMRWG